MGLGVTWYIGTILAAFMWLMGSPLYGEPGKPKRMSVAEIAAASIPVGTIFSAWIVYLVACCLSAIEYQTLIMANMIILYLVVERFPAFWRNWKELVHKGLDKSEYRDLAWVSIIVGGLGFLFWPLYSSHMIPWDKDPGDPSKMAIMSGGSCWADLPIHMHIAESFLTGRNQDVSWSDMQSPVFAGSNMYYPFLPDFHAAIMKKMGDPLRNGFLYPGFFLCLSFFALMYFLAVRLTKSRVAAIMAMLLTIGAGGMGGINLFFRDLKESGGNVNQAFWRTVERDTAQNDVSGDGKVFWFAFLPHVFLPQRGANFAYPMALLILLLVWNGTNTTRDAIAQGISPATRRSFLMHAAGFAAALPLVQAHAFIGLGVIIGIVFILDMHKWLADIRLFGGWISAGVVAILFGGPQMMMFRTQVERGHGGNFIKYGWIYRNHELGQPPAGSPPGFGPLLGFFRFWYMSLGAALPLFLLALGLLGWDLVQAAWLAWRVKAFEAPNSSTGSIEYMSLLKTLEAARGVRVPTVASAANITSSTNSANKKAKTEDGEATGSSSSSGFNSAAAAAGVRARNNVDGGVEYDFDHAKKYAPRFGPAAGVASDATLLEHLIGLTLQQLPNVVADTINDPTCLNWNGVDRFLAPLNELTLVGRGLDLLKLVIGAFAVFLMGNYINFQPWDRDNCKLFYLWIFVGSCLTGAMLAAPIEALAGPIVKFIDGPGSARLLQWIGTPPRTVLEAYHSAASGRGATEKLKDEGRGPASTSAVSVHLARRITSKAVATASLAGVVFGLILSCTTGLMMVLREYGLYHVLLDQDMIAMGEYIRANLAPKAVVVHRDTHITPSGCIAGRPTLIAYNGWMWSHGYSYYDRDRDRSYALQGVLKDSDPEVYNSLRRWGVRYVVGEWLPRHHRPGQQAYEEAVARKNANPDDPNVVVPPFNPDMYLDNQMRRVFSVGRFDLLEVLGYGFPPS